MNRHLYNNDELSEYGPFNGTVIYSARPIKLLAGDIIQVVSGSTTKPKQYYYHGAYVYSHEVKSDKPERKKYLINSLQPLNPPVEVTRNLLPEGNTFNTFIGNLTTSLRRVPEVYLELYQDLIESSGQYKAKLDSDIDRIVGSDTGVRTSINRELLCRLGQGKFKKNVERVWGSNRCALSGIDLPELLIASHIKPWASSDNGERLNGCNGILFASHIDKLFDSFIITFKELGGQFVLHSSPKIKAFLENNFRINKSSLDLGKLTPSNFREVSGFLKFHNSEFERLHIE
ncbi:MAG: hypothetical protein A2W79_08405 [Pseudomonadales bacterium RIFCSPLOWO2_12_60_38]|uniref:HNH endonuclease n=1 Tax=Pseudomonas TaxID=286 RepID=UPI0003DCC1CB|nr:MULTISPECIES: HNH endonuclease signature motif containing protein [unclassified Pseudomonas]ETK41838.1 hypothetical protein H098_09630 [Pseudomonas fluorescens FH5]OHC33527.1 MAG: hypothetical protein A2W79_08405 [Pseudomonadales bacterium RIFCSPLOWO2_12_60_38]OHC40569.1 MAG: hypothetical protein A3G72_15620 [Pseudomonadales bacterium RIFCSPLOWO2_12_FULL_59_450]PTT11559.1 HNH endonuclease [Pseudomonas sp. HMWF034]PVV70654.1 HNH endonuclease [Pseudomonas sp. HMWF011]